MTRKGLTASIVAAVVAVGSLIAGSVMSLNTPSKPPRAFGFVPRPFPPPTSAPILKSAPLITGTVSIGNTITGSIGSWSNRPTNYSEQWQRCDSTGSSCTTIGGETTLTYTVLAGDTNSTFRIQIIAANRIGSTTATSSATSIVAGGLGSALPAALPQSVPGGGRSFTGSSSSSLTTLFSNLTQPGDTLCLNTGTYGSGNAAQVVFSVSGSSSNPITIKACTGQSPVIAQLIKFTGSYIRIQGLKFTANSYPSNRASAPTCGTNTTTGSVGVWLAGSHDTFEHNEVTATTMSGIFSDTTATYDQILSNYIHDNGSSSDDQGIYWSAANTLFANNIVYHNYAFGVQLAGPSNNDTVTNNTLVSNGYGGVCLGSGAVTFNSTSGDLFVNNISANNYEYGFKTYDNSANTLTTNLVYSNATSATFGVWLGSTPTSSNPNFASSTDWHLQTGSPAIGAGTSSYTPALDYYGVARVTVDLGAIAHIGAPTNTVLPIVSGTVQEGQTLSVTTGSWTNCSGSFSCTYTYDWQRCNAGPTGCVSVASTATYTLVAGDVSHYMLAKVTATNGDGASTPASSALSGAVIAAGGGLSIGTGASDAQCSGSCTTPTTSTSGTPITVDDGSGTCAPNTYANCTGGKNMTDYIYPSIPHNLITNDVAHPVPLIIILSLGCTTNTATKNTSPCFDNSSGDQGSYGWIQESAADKIMLITLFANASGAFWDPTLYPAATTCGNSGTGTCDQIPEVQGAIAWAKSNYAIDPDRTYVDGGSKGGSMVNTIVCDPRTSSLIAGAAANTVIYSSGSTVASPPAKNGKSCPALLTPGTFTSVGSPHRIMMQWWYSARDHSFPCTGDPGIDGQPAGLGNCLNGGGLAAGYYVYSQDEQATLMWNPTYGCSNTPTSTNDGNGTVKVRTYRSCGSNAHNQVAVQTVDYSTSGCHAWGCNNNQGMGLKATMTWNFWTLGDTTP